MQHHSARPIALWLQSINYAFVPCKDSDFQSLEMGLEKSVKFDNEDIYGIPGLTDIYDESDKGYFDAVVILDFKKANHPDIQLITSRGPPLEMVLNFHSSEYLFWKEYICSFKTSLCDEHNNSRQSILHIPPGNIHRAALTSLQSFRKFIRRTLQI